MKWNIFPRRGGGFAIRVYIPAELQHLHLTASGKPKAELVRGLKTKDRKEAKAKAVALLPELTREVYQLPDPEEYRVKPTTETLTVYADDPNAKFGDPLVQTGSIRVLNDRHPELDEKVEEIASVHGDKVARDFMKKALGKVTLQTAPEEYKRHCDQRAITDPRTREKRLRHQSDFVEWYADEDAKLSDIEFIDANSYIDHLYELGQAPKTIADKVSSLRNLWQWALPLQLVKANVWRDHKVSSKAQQEKRAFTAEEIRKIRSHDRIAKEPKHIDLVTLLLFMGCRIEELCALRVDQVTLAENGSVSGVMVRDGKKGKGTKDWFPVISKEARAILKRRIKSKNPDDRVFGELVPGAQGYSHNVAKTLRAATRKALSLPATGAVDVDNHSFRRTHATAAENAGLMPHEIDRLQRRSTGSIAGDVYSSGPLADAKTKLQKRVTKELLSRYWN